MNAVSRVTLTTVLALASLEAVARVPDKCVVVLEARPTRNDMSRAPCPLLISFPVAGSAERPARDASRRTSVIATPTTGEDSEASASAAEPSTRATHA